MRGQDSSPARVPLARRALARCGTVVDRVMSQAQGHSGPGTRFAGAPDMDGAGRALPP